MLRGIIHVFYVVHASAFNMELSIQQSILYFTFITHTYTESKHTQDTKYTNTYKLTQLTVPGQPNVYF